MLNSALAFAQLLVSTALAEITILNAICRKEKSLRILAVSFTSLSACFILLIVNAKNPFIGITLPDLTLIAANTLLVYAFRLLDNHPRAWARRLWIVPGISFCALLVFTFAIPSREIRIAIVSAVIVYALTECLILLIRGFKDITPLIKRSLIAFFFLFILCNACRIALFALSFFPDANLTGMQPLTTVTLSLSIVFTIICAGSFFIIDSSRLIDGLNRNNDLLEKIAMKDELTGVLNRYSLDQTVKNEIERQDRYHEPLSLIMFDLDHFKRVNDLWGHDMGDRVLAETVLRIGKSIRDTDFIFRWGGEEFFILLPHTDKTGAATMAEKLRETLSATPIPPVGTVTASFGVAERIEGERHEFWFKRVDKAMYRAKEMGRNRVEVWAADQIYGGAVVRITWQEEWNCGSAVIDIEHRGLVIKGNELLNMALSGAPADKIKQRLDEIIVDIQTHFADEERILETAEYPEFAEHCDIHRALLADAQTARENFEKELLDPPALFHLLVDRIIVEHMLSTDVKFFPYLGMKNKKGNGVS